MTRLLLRVAYDGSQYSGFAPQTNANTVAAELQRALLSVDPAASTLTCASRTDAGVHARDQIVSFATEKDISSRGWVLALNQKLPDDIAVRSASLVDDDFEPRVDPLWKRYVYYVLQAPLRDPFWHRRAWHVREQLDLEAMHREGRTLLGQHDFAAFRSARDARTETVREIRQLSMRHLPDDERVVEFRVEGNRFLYNMVRIIVGTLVDVGRGRCAGGTCVSALASKDRTDLGMTAPPEGLYLSHVELRSAGRDAWPPAAETTPSV